MTNGWSAAFLDVFFLVLATLLMLKPQFEEPVSQIQIEIPTTRGSDGRLVVEGETLRLGLDAAGQIQHEGDSISIEEMETRARAAFLRGAQDVVLEADQETPLQAYAEVLAILRDIRFQVVRLAVNEKEGVIP